MCRNMFLNEGGYVEEWRRHAYYCSTSFMTYTDIIYSKMLEGQVPHVTPWFPHICTIITISNTICTVPSFAYFSVLLWLVIDSE